MQLTSYHVIRLQLGEWTAFSPTFKAVSLLHLCPPFQLRSNPLNNVAEGTKNSAVHMEKYGGLLRRKIKHGNLVTEGHLWSSQGRHTKADSKYTQISSVNLHVQTGACNSPPHSSLP